MDSPLQPTQIGDPLEPREEIESELGPDTDEVVGSSGLDHSDLVRFHNGSDKGH